MGEVTATQVAPAERVAIEKAADGYIAHTENVMKRKATTITDYRIIAHRHLVPFFGENALGRTTTADVNRYIAIKSRTLATKTVVNHINFMGAVFKLAMRRGWASLNPVELADRPRQGATDHDLRFLTREEIEALLRAVPEDDEGPRDRALYVTAAWAGLRQGELAALRWRDVDWSSGVIQVRQSFTHGRFTTPKSRRSVRAVPMFDRLAGELDLHHRASAHQADDDLAFAHPHTGSPFDASHIRTRFHRALAAAGVREVRFHDLRHSCGTAMAAAGCPLRTLQGYLGHASYTKTEVYADFAPDPTKGAAWAEAAFGSESVTPASEMMPQ